MRHNFGPASPLRNFGARDGVSKSGLRGKPKIHNIKIPAALVNRVTKHKKRAFGKRIFGLDMTNENPATPKNVEEENVVKKPSMKSPREPENTSPPKENQEPPKVQRIVSPAVLLGKAGVFVGSVENTPDRANRILDTPEPSPGQIKLTGMDELENQEWPPQREDVIPLQELSYVPYQHSLIGVEQSPDAPPVLLDDRGNDDTGLDRLALKPSNEMDPNVHGVDFGVEVLSDTLDVLCSLTDSEGEGGQPAEKPLLPTDALLVKPTFLHSTGDMNEKPKDGVKETNQAAGKTVEMPESSAPAALEASPSEEMPDNPKLVAGATEEMAG